MDKKRYILFFGSLTVAVLLLVLVFQMDASGDREALLSDIDEFRREVSLRKEPRTVLHGEPVPGSAWDEYRLAMNAGAACVIDDDLPNKRLLSELEVEAIDHLRLGTQRTDGRYPFKLDGDFRIDVPDTCESRRLINLAVAQSRIWIDSGRAWDAVSVLLDAATFARDTASNTPLFSHDMGLRNYSITFAELGRLILSGKLSREQLVELSRQLSIADRDFPLLTNVFAYQLIQESSELLEMSQEKVGSRRWKDLVNYAGFRFVASRQSVILDAFEKRKASLKRYEKIDQMDFEYAKRELDAVWDEELSSDNGILRVTTSEFFAPSLESHRETLAQLRILRAACEFFATGEPPAIRDPFGKNLFFKQSGSETTIWSIGKDGKNDGGVGDWNGSPDLVLSMRAYGDRSASRADTR